MGSQETSLRQRRRRETSFDISAAAVEMFAEHGYARTTIADIAGRAGVSERTFHRYCPAKEDAVRPVLEAGWREFPDAVAARPDGEPLRDGLVAALAAVFEQPMPVDRRRMLGLLVDTPALESIWLHVNLACEVRLAPIIADRLGYPRDDPRGRFTSACVVAANRLAVEAWAHDDALGLPDLLAMVSAHLDRLDGGLLRRTPTTDHDDDRNPT